MCPLARCAPAHTQEERERREGGREGERCVREMEGDREGGDSTCRERKQVREVPRER